MSTTTSQQVTKKPCDEAHIFESLNEALSIHRDTIQLAELGQFTTEEVAEMRAYSRSWAFPLGLVLDR